MGCTRSRGAPASGYEANITLPDEPESRAVGQIQILEGKRQKPIETEELLPYVAVIVAPAKSKVDDEIGSRSLKEPSMIEEANTIEEVGSTYRKRALQIAEKKLSEMNVPFRDRKPTFKTVSTDEGALLEIRYSNPEPNRVAGEWILYFDPSKPIDANPVDIKIWR